MYKQEGLVIIGIFAYNLDHLALSLIYKYERHILYLPTVNSEKCWPLILILNSPLVSFHTRNSPGVGARNNELLVDWHWLIAHLKPILTAFTFQQHFRREFQNKLSEICRCIFLHSWLTIAVGPRLTSTYTRNGFKGLRIELTHYPFLYLSWFNYLRNYTWIWHLF